MEVQNHAGSPGDQHRPSCPHANVCPHCGAPRATPYPTYPYVYPYTYPYRRPYATWGTGSSGSPPTPGYTVT